MVNYGQIIRVSTQNQTKLTKTNSKLADLGQTRRNLAKTLLNLDSQRWMNPNFKSNLNFEGFEVSFITETIKTIGKKWRKIGKVEKRIGF